MSTKVMVIFTAKSLESCLKVEGSQSWVLDRSKAKRCKYAVLCRNAHTDWGDGKEPHGTAFMIGRICDVVTSTDKEGRWLVKFDEYARIDKANIWKGWRNPIRYLTLEDLSFTIDDVVFEAMPKIIESQEKTEPKSSQITNGLTIADAKKGLAMTFGVKQEAVEIIIHG